MPRHYQRTKNNPYWLPPNLYRKMIYHVRDYDRLREEYENVLSDSPFLDNRPKKSSVGDPTANKAIRREKIFVQMAAVDQALRQIPEEYRCGIIEHVKYGSRYPSTAHYQTYKMWQARFIYLVAERLGEI